MPSLLLGDNAEVDSSIEPTSALSHGTSPLHALMERAAPSGAGEANRHHTASTPPLAFLHGFLGQPASWGDVQEALGETHRTISLPLPGHGLDPWKPSHDTFESTVDAIAAALEERVWLVGYSLGARVALTLLLRHPERVAGAVLVGCNPGLRTEAERAARIADDDAAAARLERDGLDAFVRDWEALPLFASQRALPASQQERRRQERLQHTPHGLAWALRTLGLGRMPSAWGALPHCQFPIHLVTGERDEKFTALNAELRTLAPQIPHTVVPGVGHDVSLEAPAVLSTIIRQTIGDFTREST